MSYRNQLAIVSILRIILGVFVSWWYWTILPKVGWSKVDARKPHFVHLFDVGTEINGNNLSWNTLTANLYETKCHTKQNVANANTSKQQNVCKKTLACKDLETPCTPFCHPFQHEQVCKSTFTKLALNDVMQCQIVKCNVLHHALIYVSCRILWCFFFNVNHITSKWLK